MTSLLTTLCSKSAECENGEYTQGWYSLIFLMQYKAWKGNPFTCVRKVELSLPPVWIGKYSLLLTNEKNGTLLPKSS